MGSIFVLQATFDFRLIVLSDPVPLSLANVAFLSTLFSPIRADAKTQKDKSIGDDTV